MMDALYREWQQAESRAQHGTAQPEPYPGCYRQAADLARDRWVAALVAAGLAQEA